MLLSLPAYEKPEQDPRRVRLMQVRTGFPNAVSGDVFRGDGSPESALRPPQTVRHELAGESGASDYEARPFVRSDEQTPYMRDDDDAIVPVTAQQDSSGARSATAGISAPAGDDYFSRLEQRLAQQGAQDDAGSQAVQGEVLVYDSSQREVARGVRKRVIPEYPAAEQVVGTVYVRIDITPDGRAVDAMVVRKLGPAFDAASLDAARGWLFDAAPEGTWHNAVIKFRYVLE